MKTATLPALTDLVAHTGNVHRRAQSVRSALEIILTAADQETKQYALYSVVDAMSVLCEQAQHVHLDSRIAASKAGVAK